MICRAESTWDRACCLARLPSRDSRIFARDGLLDFTLFTPFSLLLSKDGSLSDGTPIKEHPQNLHFKQQAHNK